jgi:transposase
MEVLHPKCAGLDVHKDTVVACARIASGSEVRREVVTFGTTTGELMALADWLAERECSVVLMEATGVYWKPIWHVLANSEAGFALVLANAAHVKNVPGRKTDINDATWLAELLAHGLVRGSFVPEIPIQELRGLTRTRKQLVRERSQHVLRIHKTLEEANMKMASVMTDIMGLSGQRILAALVNGETNPKVLASLTIRLKASDDQVVEALRGHVTAQHRFLLKVHLELIDHLDAALQAVEAEAGTILEPFRVAVDLLKTVPGVSDATAETVVAEIGVDMSRFPTAGHLISWAGLCPGNHESAGKRKSSRIRHGAPWLKTALVQAAQSAARTRGTYLQAQYHRLKGRRGAKKAAVAVASSMLKSMYFMLRDGAEYRDLGADHFDRHNKDKTVSRLVKRLRDLGCHVAVKVPRSGSGDGVSS